MPQADTTGRFTVYMSRDAIDQLTKAAKELGFKSGAEYARDLIKRDMEERGQPIDFGLDTWGRTRKEDEDAPPDEKPKKGKKKTD